MLRKNVGAVAFILALGLVGTPRAEESYVREEFWHAAGGEQRYVSKGGEQALEWLLQRGENALSEDPYSGDSILENARALGRELARQTQGEQRPKLTAHLMKKVKSRFCPGLYPYC